MTSTLGSRLRTVDAEERVTGVRALLTRPLLLAGVDEEGYRAVVRQRGWLQRWFADHTGWRLDVEPRAGFARLHRVPARADATRPARVPGRARTFDRRRYVLLCLTLAALDESPVQTTLARLAELVEGASADDPDLERFEPERAAERRAFVDVLRWLDDVGLLRLRDGDTERYAATRKGDALYDVDDHLLGHLVCTPVPPTLAGSAAKMGEEHYPDTAEGARLRARHHVVRSLLDDPVVYYDDLAPDARDWLDHSRGYVYRLLEEDVGLGVERRREGLAAIDPRGRLSDTLFPDGASTAKHAALLLAEALAAEQRATGATRIARAGVEELVRGLFEDFSERCHWSKAYSGDEHGIAALTEDAMGLLEAFGLAAPDADGWCARPAIARFAPAAPSPGVG